MCKLRNVLERVASQSSATSLLAVTKGRSSEEVNKLAVAMKSAGLKVFIGESYIQELQKKKKTLKNVDEIHFIGRLQSNKVKEVIQECDVIQSVGRKKILDLIEKEVINLNKRIQRIFIQVNVSGDEGKDGFAPSETPAAIAYVQASPVLHLEGLMTITRAYDDPEDARKDFGLLKRLATESEVCGLSMGMSADFEVAIQEGSTMVRIGSALF
jgi:PLP dependent protein